MRLAGSWPLVAVLAVAAFLLGALSPAAILARVRGGDLRGGSGNLGATNVGRVLGVRWGIAVGVLDVLKGLLPTVVVLLLVNRPTAYVVGLALVLGHVLSPYLRGRVARAWPRRSGRCWRCTRTSWCWRWWSLPRASPAFDRSG